MSLQTVATTLAMWLFVLCAASADAAEWFVAPGGSGPGTSAAPFGRIQDALDAARPGDIVTVRGGTYHEALRSVRGGTAQAPILIQAGAPRSAVVTASGRVLRVDHPHLVVQGLVFDGQFGLADTLAVGDEAHYLTLRDVEVRRSSRDLIDIGSPRGVLIEGALIHHALNARNGRTDAHGIAAGAVRDLTIRDTEIHTFSGDGVQVDPGRSAPGWTGVTIERTRIWLAPLPAPMNGFPAGAVTGENAVDTKANPALPRAILTIREVTASGFRNGLISNMAAFNLKERIQAIVDRVTVFDSEIAFRLRGNRSTDAGAWVTVSNAVIHDTSTAFRYEDDIRQLNVWNVTIGANVSRPFRAASSNASGLDVRNVLVLGSLPPEANHASNQAATEDAFVEAAAGDYRLAPDTRARNAGIALPDVTADRAGVSRPQETGYDVGAFEYAPPRRTDPQ